MAHTYLCSFLPPAESWNPDNGDNCSEIRKQSQRKSFHFGLEKRRRETDFASSQILFELTNRKLLLLMHESVIHILTYLDDGGAREASWRIRSISKLKVLPKNIGRSSSGFYLIKQMQRRTISR